MEQPIDKFVNSILKACGEYNRYVMSEKIKAGLKKAKLEGKNVFPTQKQG